MKPTSNNRRKFLQLGLGATAGLITTSLGCTSNNTQAHAQELAEAEACKVSAQQTLGPFYPHVKNGDGDVDLTTIQGREGQAEGQVILVRGRILDEACQPVPDALVEIWQANHHGRYVHEGDAENPRPLDPYFQGWGEVRTDAEAGFGFRTIKPAAYPVDPANPVEWRTPHIHFRVSRRGYHEIVTQMYFAGEARNEEDLILNDLPEADRGGVIISPQDNDAGIPVFTFNLTLKKVPTNADRMAALEACTGRYDMRVPFGQGDEGVVIRRNAQRLLLDIPGYSSVELAPQGKDEFVSMAISRRFVFNRDADRRVNSVTVHKTGQVADAVPKVAKKIG